MISTDLFYSNENLLLNTGKALITLLYNNSKTNAELYNEIAQLITKQYNSYVKMDNMMNMNPNAKTGSMCQIGMAMIVGNTSEAVLAIIEKVLNAFVTYRNGLQNV